ncbi:helix-turn-helix transcriptional regulator [Pyxidicoccus sp. MSG2]|uniref:helix-turn-helix transcriptional regulator n=1 Tax=Pyxidicoccus sp. MSG2 TaxID=2996790 RepID=UPI00226F40F4|nr:helix-turn-helix transcriptional regulator [Pyxidicoccus sp. MSG2]MCY1020075.1 helix-turn-helix transcriptional regulator [Pyxidicoccus sp. MSG2]
MKTSSSSCERVIPLLSGAEKSGAYTGMTANSLPKPAVSLGSFLRERRSRLQPEPGSERRRRTPGLRREEVATRAGVSVTWYTWLEQGRGGPPSEEVLERLARALELDPASRELLFLIAQQRPPPLVPAPLPAVPAALQRVLDGLPTSPAIVKTPTWDIVAWNKAATAVLTDYAALPVQERNVLRRLFGNPASRASLPDWEDNARFAVAVFRIDVARAGGSAEADALTAELQATSADFRRLWADTDVQSHGVGVKRIRHPRAGLLHLEYSAFAVDGAEGLTMIVFTPASAADVRSVEAVLAHDTHGGRSST